ncbi:phage tail tape measure protein [Castellaniella sp.]|uniref:phage tail tape measure protein n=1 Tax=Castellaniella sp. TaxID=1955812 RepID=UPI0035602BC5
MADDIVSFGMEIDSSSARKAKEDLDRLAKSGPAVEQSLNKLKTSGSAGAAGVSAVSRASQTAKRDLEGLRSSASGVGLSLQSIGRGLGYLGVLAGVGGGLSIGAALGAFVRNTNTAQAAQAQLAAVLKSTGNAAGLTAQQLNLMAEALSKSSVFSVDEITQAQTHLLAYANIAGDQIPRAMQATIDTAARMGMSVVQAAETVGRALDVPSQGMASLTRQGFRFSDAEKALVKSLEAAGRAGEAQAIVLKALEESYGGAAVAARDTLGGALQSLSNTIATLFTGSEESLRPLVDTINSINDALSSRQAEAALHGIVVGVEALSAVLVGRLVGAIGATTISMVAANAAAIRQAASLTGLSAAARTAAASIAAATTAGRAFALLTGPIGAVLVAVGFAAEAMMTYSASARDASLNVRDLAAATDESTQALNRMSQAQRDARALELRDQIAAAESQLESLNGKINIATQSYENNKKSIFSNASAQEYWTRKAIEWKGQAADVTDQLHELRAALEAIVNFKAPEASPFDPLMGQMAAYQKFMDDHATREEKYRKERKSLQESLGPYFSESVDKRLRESIFGKPAAGGSATATRTNELQGLIARLNEEQATLGMSEAAIERYRIAQMKGTEADRARALAIYDQIQAWKEADRAIKQAQETSRMDAAMRAETDIFAQQQYAPVIGAGMGKRARELMQEELQIRQGFAQQRRQLEEAQAAASTRIDEDQYKERLRLLQKYEDEQVAIMRSASEDKRAAEADWTKGASEAIRNYYDEVSNVAGMTEDAMTNAFHGMEDALVQFAMTGKLNFTDLANSILSDMMRIMIRAMIMKPLMEAIGMGGGGTGMATFAGNFASAFGGDAIGAMLPFLAEGGYTGDGPRYQPAGIVHRGEGVLSQPEIRAIGGPAGFEALRRAIRGPGHAMGGMAANPKPAPGGFGRQTVLNQNITINAPDANSFRKSQGQISRELGLAANRAIARA